MYITVSKITGQIKSISSNPISETKTTIVFNKPEITTNRTEFLRVVKDNEGNIADVVEKSDQEKQIIIKNNVRRIRQQKIEQVHRIREEKENGEFKINEEPEEKIEQLTLIVGDEILHLDSSFEGQSRLNSILQSFELGILDTSATVHWKFKDKNTGEIYYKDLTQSQLKSIASVITDYVEKLFQTESLHINNLKNFDETDEEGIRAYDIYKEWPDSVYKFDSWNDVNV